MSTMLSRKCAESLRMSDQPYQALHETIAKDFLGNKKFRLCIIYKICY